MANFTLNCSRIGVTGGLRSFAEEVMACLNDPSSPLEAVLPESTPAPPGIVKISVPRYIAITSIGSILRPIAWLVYSRFCFPVPAERRVLCPTHHVLPGRKNQIVTVLDLRPYFFPDSLVQRFYFRHMLPRALRRCDGILTVSETSRRLLMDVYGLPEAFIRVIPIAIRLQSLSAAQMAVIDRPASPEYLLMVGASYPHKNADEVLRMHRLWATRFRLKIVATNGSYRSELQSQVAALGIGDRVDFLSGIDDSELQHLYANCAALVYPSKIEGFGLPPLEAMSCGRQVIVSDIPIFRELYGSLPHFVTLGSEASWEQAFRNIDRPAHDYAAKAAAHVNSFSLDRMKDALTSALRYFWG